MVRHNLSSLRVHQTATHWLARSEKYVRPAWFDAVETNPPSQTLVRMQNLQLQEQKRRSKAKKPSKSFQPTEITYEEDQLRQTFFADHPWELARPRMVLETDGKDREKEDWSKIRQPQRPISGESVIRRQLWLLQNNQSLTRAQAYDQARKEFYDERLREAIERLVAKEEALSTGAYFGKSALQVGMEMEDREYEKWKSWALELAAMEKAKRATMYTGDKEEGSEVSSTNAGLANDLDADDAVGAAEI